jgi:hypothetical protein
MTKLKKITTKELSNKINEFDIGHIKQGQPIFELINSKKMKKREIDSLIEIEIALRKCKRVGVFGG